MLARLDKPLRQIGTVKMAEAQFWGGTIVAIAPEKPWPHAFHA
jgi:hypothetical protein